MNGGSFSPKKAPAENQGLLTDEGWAGAGPREPTGNGKISHDGGVIVARCERVLKGENKGASRWLKCQACRFHMFGWSPEKTEFLKLVWTVDTGQGIGKGIR